MSGSPSPAPRYSMSGVVQAHEPRIVVSGAKDRGSKPRRFNAVIDTGATVTTIADVRAQEMGLRLLQRRDVSTANGIVNLPFYALFVIVIGEQPTMTLTRTIVVAGATSLVGDMLYGMDMLSGGRFKMTLDAHGKGHWNWQEQ